MTAAQLKKIRAKNKADKLREKRAAKKLRESIRKEKRKIKRQLKAAPKIRLRKWAKRVTAGGKCEVCGKTPHKIKTKKGKDFTVGIDAHHILPKERYPLFKFKQINGIALCKVHHKYGRYSFHRNPAWSMVWLKKNQPRKYKWAVKHMGDWTDEPQKGKQKT